MKSSVDSVSSRRTFLSLLTLAVMAPGCRQPAAEPAADTCMAGTALSESARAARKGVAYIDQTSISERRCDNCQFWLPRTAERPCDTCAIVPGVIAAAGYCTSWAAASST